ncbi:MAG: hypothetical protein WAL63_15420 [Solirubrobacteraceae bacterium]
MIHLVGAARRQRAYTPAYDYLEPALQYAMERGLELRGVPQVWPPLDEALSLADRREELQASQPVAAARAEAAWLDGEHDGVDSATAAALSLARLRRSRWVVAELAAWRRRAGIDDRLADGETAGPYALEIAADWSLAAARWRELGCPYDAALALGSADDEGSLRQALDELQSLGSKPGSSDHRAATPRARRARPTAGPTQTNARESRRADSTPDRGADTPGGRLA